MHGVFGREAMDALIDALSVARNRLKECHENGSQSGRMTRMAANPSSAVRCSRDRR